MRHLPQSGQVALTDMVNILATAEGTYAIPSNVVFRVVVYQDSEGRLRLFSGRLIVGIDDPPDGVTITKAGPLRLIEVAGDTSDLSTVEGVAGFLLIWRTLLKTSESSITLQRVVNVWRDSSHGARATPPCWHFDLEYSDDESMAGNAPQGPFIDPTGSFFATNLGDAAAEWLGVPFYRQQTNPEKRINVTLIDNRAYLTNLAFDDPVLGISVHNATFQKLRCTVLTTDYHDVRHRQTLLVTDADLRLDLVRPVKSLEIYLTNEEGFCFDSYHENELRSSRSLSLLSYSAKDSQLHASLSDALATGETECVEFKEYLPLDRKQRKAIELQRTVCAFANSLGGDLFIGVTDELEIVGCAKILAELSKALKQPREDCRNHYAQLLKRIIAEGISPTVPVEISWVSHVGLDVLRVTVPKTGAAHHVVESNDTFVRRGANSKKATPSEIEALLRTGEKERSKSAQRWMRAL